MRERAKFTRKSATDILNQSFLAIKKLIISIPHIKIKLDGLTRLKTINIINVNNNETERNKSLLVGNVICFTTIMLFESQFLIFI
jgi:hypothetical protein